MAAFRDNFGEIEYNSDWRGRAGSQFAVRPRVFRGFSRSMSAASGSACRVLKRHSGGTDQLIVWRAGWSTVLPIDGLASLTTEVLG